jgi:choline kinase
MESPDKRGGNRNGTQPGVENFLLAEITAQLIVAAAVGARCARPACCTCSGLLAAVRRPPEPLLLELTSEPWILRIFMRAIILAAGKGVRLQLPEDGQVPKCLLRFGGMTLLERHLRILKSAGIGEVVLALGFRHELVEAELDRLDWALRPEIVLNLNFELGSVLTLHTVAQALTRGGDVLLMDADVLYDERILRALVKGNGPLNRLLMDRNFEAGEEAVKLCLRSGAPVELRKQLAAGLQFDMVGESVGFFRFDEIGAQRLAVLIAGYVDSGRAHLPHEEAVRDLIKEGDQLIEVADVTGLPWIEIDFPGDVMCAAREVLPRLQPLSGGG